MVLELFNYKANQLNSSIMNNSKHVEDNDFENKNIVKIDNIPDVYRLKMMYKKIINNENHITFNNDLDSNYFFFKILFTYITNLKYLSSSVMTRDNVFPEFKKHTNNIIEIKNGLFCKIISFQYNYNDFEPENCEIELYSKIFNLNDMYNFLHKIKEEYNINLNKDLTKNSYYFDQFIGNNIPAKKMLPSGEEVEVLETLPKKVSFIKKKFKTFRTFDTLSGENTRLIQNKVKFFQENESWYKKKGIPYHLGLLFSGIPGTGKTSAIKAIANYTNRHIINVHLKNIRTKEQLFNLLTEDTIEIYDNKELKNLNIPIEKRLYVLEEIDCFGDIVLKRNLKSNKKVNNNNPLEITLGDILTILDGNVEYPGRIVIITSNHPEKLDPALLRGGRIDLKVNYTYCKTSEIIEYIEFYYETKISEDMKIKIESAISNENSVLSFSDLTQNCFSFELEEAIDNLIHYNKEKLDNSKVEIEDTNTNNNNTIEEVDSSIYAQNTCNSNINGNSSSDEKLDKRIQGDFGNNKPQNLMEKERMNTIQTMKPIFSV
jgi:AAA+ superfamily predicted ATPase